MTFNVIPKGDPWSAENSWAVAPRMPSGLDVPFMWACELDVCHYWDCTGGDM